MHLRLGALGRRFPLPRSRPEHRFKAPGLIARGYASAKDGIPDPSTGNERATAREAAHALDPQDRAQRARPFRNGLGVEYTGFSFVEEPLGLWYGGGAGWFRYNIGSTFTCPDESGTQSYEIVRKLGWGRDSSVWLARTKQPELRYVAMKILTGYATAMHRLDRYKEVLAVDRLRQISSPFAEYALPVRNISLIQGKYDNDGDHAYFTTDLYGGSVESLRHLPPAKPSLAKDDDPRRLPKKLAKRILLHVLRGIAHTHRCFVVHGDIRPSNVLFSVPKGFTTRNITDWITADPPRFNPPEQSDYCTVQSSVSQPLPLPASLDEVMDRTFVLADYGGALTLTKDPSESRSSCSFYYQAPEVILGAYCDEKMDIWSFGCMAYELLTGEPLFWPDERAASAGVQVQKGIMLHQMMCFAAETFSREQLAASEHARTWFDDDGRFQMYRHILTPQPLSFICVFMDRAPLESLDDIMPTAYFLEQCFRLDPERRPTSGKPGLDYNYL